MSQDRVATGANQHHPLHGIAVVEADHQVLDRQSRIVGNRHFDGVDAQLCLARPKRKDRGEGFGAGCQFRPPCRQVVSAGQEVRHAGTELHKDPVGKVVQQNPNQKCLAG